MMDLIVLESRSLVIEEKSCERVENQDLLCCRLFKASLEWNEVTITRVSDDLRLLAAIGGPNLAQHESKTAADHCSFVLIGRSECGLNTR